MYPPPQGRSPNNNNPQGYSQINNPYPNIDNNYQNQYPPMNPGGYNDPNMFMNPGKCSITQPKMRATCEES